MNMLGPCEVMEGFSEEKAFWKRKGEKENQQKEIVPQIRAHFLRLRSTCKRVYNLYYMLIVCVYTHI